jgi:hypothetical protein
MGRDKEDIQNRLTLQMEKTNRRSDKRPDDLTLAEQLIKRAAYDKLTIEQKRAALPYTDWKSHVQEFMIHKKKITTNSLFQKMSCKYANEMHAFHDSGCSLLEIINFVEEKSGELSNDHI